MKFASLDHFQVSPWRMGLLGSFASALAAVGTTLALGNAFGAAKGAVVFVVAALVFYIVVSTPRRVLDSQRASQARESLPLSAAAAACLGVIGSRARTVLLLRSRDAVVSRALTQAGRDILLGVSVPGALADSAKGLSSYSAAASLQRIGSSGSESFDPGDEETRGLASASELSRETKLPVFMTACFFTPIMLLLYSVFSHSYSPGDMVELTAFEFIALDLAFYLSSSGREVA